MHNWLDAISFTVQLQTGQNIWNLFYIVAQDLSQRDVVKDLMKQIETINVYLFLRW